MEKKYIALSVLAAIATFTFASSAESATTYRAKSPAQIIIMKQQAIPRAIGVRQIFTNGQATTVSGALVTDYVWGRQTMNARVFQGK